MISTRRRARHRAHRLRCARFAASILVILATSCCLVFSLSCALAGDTEPPAGPPSLTDIQQQLQNIAATLEGFQHRLDVLEKRIDDVLWYERVGDVAVIDKVRLYGPPPWKEESETAIGAGNPVKFYAYIFLPRQLDRSTRMPLLVFPHGGVHSDFSTY